MSLDRVYTHVMITPVKIHNIFIIPKSSPVPMSCQSFILTVTLIVYYQTSFPIIPQLGSDTFPVLLKHQCQHHVTYTGGKKKQRKQNGNSDELVAFWVVSFFSLCSFTIFQFSTMTWIYIYTLKLKIILFLSYDHNHEK